MVLISTVLIVLNNEKLLQNYVNIKNYDKTLHNNIYILIYVAVMLLFTTVPAVLVSVNCNPGNKLLYGIIAFFFSDIYLLQWAIRKFVLKSNYYCKI